VPHLGKAHRTVCEFVHDHVVQRPDAAAVSDLTGRRISYRRLWELSGSLAHRLAAQGVTPGSYVPVALDRSIESVTAMLAVLRAGAAYVMADPAAPASRCESLLQDTAPPAMVGGDSATWRELRSRYSVAEVRASTPAGSWAEALPAPNDPCYVAYTSGSTGRPKGIVVPHRAVARLIDEPTYCTVLPGSRVAHLADPAFDATTFEVWAALTAGAEVVVFPPALEVSALGWEETLRNHRIDSMFVTSALFDAIARDDLSAFRSLDTVLFGGEVSDPALVHAVCRNQPPSRLVHVYGPTEATTFATYFDCTAESTQGRSRIPIGYPIQQTSLHVVGGQGSETAAGEIGELLIGGPGVALGYLNRPAATAAAFTDDGEGGIRYHTGDLVRRLADGSLEFVGRTDRQVKVRGFRVELEEVELAAIASGAVRAVAVEKMGDGPAAHLVGFCVPTDPGSSPDEVPDSLIVALRSDLPAYMQPARWLALGEMPMTLSGKIDRARLRSLADPGPKRGADSIDPPPTEATNQRRDVVCAVLAELLRLPAVSESDSFSALGGTSIVALQAAARLRRSLGVEVHPSAVLASSTVGDLIDVVELLPALQDAPA
jgi:amino acid adenylation domain-containing protein